MTVRNDSSVVNRNKTLDYQAKISIRFGFISFCLSDDPLIQPVSHYDHLFMIDPTQLSKQGNISSSLSHFRWFFRRVEFHIT